MRIAIVGAGPAGCHLAHRLARVRTQRTNQLTRSCYLTHAHRTKSRAAGA